VVDIAERSFASSRRCACVKETWLNSGLLLKQFLAPFRLRIIWVLNLDPMWRSFLGHAVNGIAPLRNDAFKIKFADLSEEFFATRLDVILRRGSVTASDVEVS